MDTQVQSAVNFFMQPYSSAGLHHGPPGWAPRGMGLGFGLGAYGSSSGSIGNNPLLERAALEQQARLLSTLSDGGESPRMAQKKALDAAGRGIGALGLQQQQPPRSPAPPASSSAPSGRGIPVSMLLNPVKPEVAAAAMPDGFESRPLISHAARMALFSDLSSTGIEVPLREPSQPNSEDGMARNTAPDASARGKHFWTKEEDELVLQLVEKRGPRNWDALAAHFPTRTGHQVRLRYNNYLRYNDFEKHAPFTEQQDRIILEAGNQSSRKWSVVARDMGRSYTAVKNRFHVLMRRMKRHSRTDEES